MIPIVPNQNTHYYTIAFPFFFSNLENCNGFEPFYIRLFVFFGRLSQDLAVKYCRSKQP
jgi:hypothetical protein